MPDRRWAKVEERIADCKAVGGAEFDLQVIDLSDASFAASIFARVVRQFPHLQSLNFLGVNLTDAGLEALAAQAKHLGSLQKLCLMGTQVGDAGLAALAAQAEHLGSLWSLDLSARQVGDAGLEALAAQAKHLGSLRLLCLMDTQVGDAGLAALATQAEHLGSLQELSLKQTQVGDAGLAALAAQAEHLGSLRELDLPHTQVGDEGLAALAAEAKHLGSLRSLNLTLTQVGDAGLVALAAQAEHLSSLRELSLSHTQVGDAGLAALAAQAKHLSSLKYLFLSQTQVGDAGLKALAAQAKHLGSLQSLGLNHTLVKSVRKEVLRTDDAQQIFKAFLRGRVVPEAKLLVLGEPRVGKSSLCQRVFENTDPAEPTETHEFDLIEPVWRPQIDGNVEVQLRVWDFGGQHILHGTHELFLTPGSVCLLVLDVTQVQERDPTATDATPHGNRLSYWLKMVRHFSGAATPVIIVVTKWDRADEHHLAPLKPDRLGIDCKFSSQIQVVNGFSAIGDEPQYATAIEELRHAIEDALGQFEGLSRGRVSAEQFNLKQRIEREIKKRALVSLAEYREWCADAGITNQRTQEVHLRTLHNFGSVFYFGITEFDEEQRHRPGDPDDLPLGQRRLLKAHRDSVLQNWLINPHWLKWPVYEIVRKSQEPIWLTRLDILQAVQWITTRMNLEQPAEGADVVRAVLELSELCLYDDSKTAWFFPRGLKPDATPFLTGWEQRHEVPPWRWGFFPETVVHRFLVKAHRRHEVLNNAYWQTGAVLKYGNATAAVQSEPESGVVTVWLKKSSASAQVPDPDELKLVERIKHRFVELIGREPDQKPQTWEPETPSQQVCDVASLSLTECSQPIARTDGARFQKKGDFWDVSFAGKSTTVKHRIGLKYIAHLISKKYQPIGAIELRAAASGQQPVRPSAGTEVADAPAMREYRKRFEELEEELQEARRNNDLGKQERIQTEISSLAKQVESAKGFGGRIRKLGDDDAERARKSVSRAIAQAFEAIRNQHLVLARHLEDSIELGHSPRYSPKTDVDWVV